MLGIEYVRRDSETNAICNKSSKMSVNLSAAWEQFINIYRFADIRKSKEI